MLANHSGAPWYLLAINELHGTGKAISNIDTTRFSHSKKPTRSVGSEVV